MSRRTRAGLSTAVLAAAAALAGCTSTAPAPPAEPGAGGASAAGGPITVNAADDACDVAAQEAAILPGLNTLAFDVSAVIPPDSWYGTLLKGIFNFSPQTTVFEAVVWVVYVATVLTLFLLPQRKSVRSTPPASVPNAS